MKTYVVSLVASLVLSAAASNPSDKIYAPAQRIVKPVSLYQTTGTVLNASNLGQGTSFQGINSTVTYDFGINIGGTVQFTVSSLSGSSEYLGFTFTESSQWISPYVCDSGTSALRDSPLWFSVPAEGKYAAPKERQRGGFRYLSIWHNSTGELEIKDLAANVTVDPTVQDLRAYTGYFKSDRSKLDRVWYAGAWTNQLCLVDPAYNNALGVPGDDWYYNETISNGSTVLIDGAKRDRLVWPGDIFISGPSIFVSTNRLDGIRNGIDSIMVLQASDGRLPWAGVPFTGPGRFQFSFTYHHYTLLDLYDYYTYTGDLEYLRNYWEQYKKALEWSLSQVDASGFANVTSTNDWLRSGMGGHNGEANAILYRTLDVSRELATAVGDESVIANYTRTMTGIKSAINSQLWDPSQGLYYDNTTIRTADSVHPQDGNSWAILAGIASPEQAANISTALMNRWVRPYGAPAPEAGPTISPFASGFEVQAHYLAGFPERAEQLIEFMWADFMLDDPRMTNSSFIEGYATDGSLHYAPYDNDARISYAHGWGTSPTSSLTFYAAGLRVTGPAGKSWEIQPQLGELKEVETGYETKLGGFAASWNVSEGGALTGSFSTPKGTSGDVILPKGGVKGWRGGYGRRGGHGWHGGHGGGGQGWHGGNDAGGIELHGSHHTIKPTRVEGDTVVFENVPGGEYKVTSGRRGY